MPTSVTIIGSGLGGSFLAIALAKEGYSVTVFESRKDPRKNLKDAGKSFNLTLYYRGIQALKKLTIWQDVLRFAIKAEGNVCHSLESGLSFDPFDKTGNEVLYTIHRSDLNRTLITLAESAGVRFSFEHKFIDLDKKTKRATLKNLKTGKSKVVSFDFLIGADGVHSAVRPAIQKGRKASFQKEYESWGYKEVNLPIPLVKKLKLRKNSTHTWPRPDSLLIAFPNADKTFTLMLNLPLQGKDSFETLTTEQAIKAYISTVFPDLMPALSAITASVLHKPTGSFVTVYTEPWYYKDVALLIGDAAHGVIPFYGQGMCAAFEDVLVLVSYLKQFDKREAAFVAFQKERKRNTDVLASLSRDNFVELRDKSRSSVYIMRNKVNTALNKIFPFWLPPLYKLIAHDDQNYADAKERFDKQQKIAKVAGISVLTALLAAPFAIRSSMKKRSLSK